MAPRSTSPPVEDVVGQANKESDWGVASALRFRVPPRALLPILSLFALFVYGLFLVVLPDRWAQNESTDYARFYRPVAENLMAGKGLVTPDGSFAVRYPPGYPLLLAGILELARVTSARESVLFLSLNGLVVLAIPLLIFGIASTVFDQSTALLAGALAATYPLYLWLTKQPNTEIPFLPV